MASDPKIIHYKGNSFLLPGEWDTDFTGASTVAGILTFSDKTQITIAGTITLPKTFQLYASSASQAAWPIGPAALRLVRTDPGAAPGGDALVDGPQETAQIEIRA